MKLNSPINVIGAGLAGTEAAWQIANFGLPVNLIEMRPSRKSPAHHSADFAELVCSNSFGTSNRERAPGLLHEELRILNSLVIKTADKFSLPAGGALAVDRSKFSSSLTKTIEENPLINIKRFEQEDLPHENQITIIATGPLSSEKFANNLRAFTGLDSCHFFDAASPIIEMESINLEIVFKASRYDKGEADYLNCPFEKDKYNSFWEALISAEQCELKDFEKESAQFFEGCLPIEELARRGIDTMRYGPLKPIGIWNPEWGNWQDNELRAEKRPHAIVQLRKENLQGTLWNLVGFQTNLKWSEQKRVFRMIPGLEKAEFLRYGVMHKNTFLESPNLLSPTLQFRKRKNLFAAGQITGTEGYAAAAAGGCLAGINAALLAKGKTPITLPSTTIIGSLINFISNQNKYLEKNKKRLFQPMPANFGLMPAFEEKIKNKQLRYAAYKERAIKDIKAFTNETFNSST